MSVRVVSYNILVPDVAEQPGYFYKCHPKYIDINYRLRLIQSELHREITQHPNTIICLQELCPKTIPSLKEVFDQRSYTLIHKLYVLRNKKYRSDGIAVPNWLRPSSVKFINVANKIEEHLTPKGTDRWSSWIDRWWHQTDKYKKSSLEPWDLAINRKNILIFLKVMINGTPLCIGTYHMPCLYKTPDVMLIHAIAAKDIMLELADGYNMILAGDFNLKPTDAGYRAITERGFAQRHLPKSKKYKIRHRTLTNLPLRSAYAEKNGNEPHFTAFSSTLNAHDFCETLDYILFRSELQVQRVLLLPVYPTSDSYPDATHPSDHLMIAATFRFD